MPTPSDHSKRAAALPGTRCPICGKPPAPPPPPPSPHPFCSQRCKFIDLGRWFDGVYRIPVVEREDEAKPDDPAR